jgi:hypothetical protein
MLRGKVKSQKQFQFASKAMLLALKKDGMYVHDFR